MIKKLKKQISEAIIIFCSLVLILVINGAIPFLTLPVVLQGFWATGFAESISHGSIFNIFAADIGYPQPAAIAFGLSAVLPMSWLIKLGMYGADAYSLIFAIWLGIAFYSCMALAKNYKLSFYSSILLALTWLTMPIVWGHNGYSMLQLGIALLPFYFLNFLNFINLTNFSNNNVKIILLLITPFIAIFMDGYTFIFYACGSSFILFSSIFKNKNFNIFTVKISFIYFLSLALAYLAYSTFIGKDSFGDDNLNFFRGWGLDLRYIVQPTKGMHWLPDFLGLSQRRHHLTYFGDGSVWGTTFFLPIFVLALVAFLRNKSKNWLSYSVFIVFILSLYMALGPTLKVNTVRPIQTASASKLMTAEQGVISTGNAIISQYIPGFKAMRASYRWSALAIFALWLLVLLSYKQSAKKDKLINLGLILIILINLPNLHSHFKQKIETRKGFIKNDIILVNELQNVTKPGNIVLFIPSLNDFFVNYLVPKANLKSFNIGGDKNLILAKQKWPEEVFGAARALDSNNISPQIKLLASGKADILIVPFTEFLLINNCGKFPVIEKECIIKNTNIIDFYNTIKNIEYLEIKISNSFYAVKLASNFSGVTNHNKLKALLLNNISYPIYFNLNKNSNPYILTNGWHMPEENFNWSIDKATLDLLAPEDCKIKNCLFKLTFNYINNDNKNIIITNNGKLTNPVIVKNNQNNQPSFDFIIPIDPSHTLQQISLEIPNIHFSQPSIAGQQDHRILGAALAKIELIQN